jgi:predicted transcriptional regulator
MLENGLSGLLVMGEEMEGIITKTNILQLIAELEGMN